MRKEQERQNHRHIERWVAGQGDEEEVHRKGKGEEKQVRKRNNLSTKQMDVEGEFKKQDENIVQIEENS